MRGWNISSSLTHTKRSCVNYLSSTLLDWWTLQILERSWLPYWEFYMVHPKCAAEHWPVLIMFGCYCWIWLGSQRRLNSVIGAYFASFCLILQPDKGRFLHFDHLTFWVGNAKQVNRIKCLSDWFLATRQYILRRNQITYFCSSLYISS